MKKVEIAIFFDQIRICLDDVIGFVMPAPSFSGSVEIMKESGCYLETEACCQDKL